MEDRGVEIGVVADLDRRQQLGPGLGGQVRPNRVLPRWIGQQPAQPPAQRARCVRARGHQPVEPVRAARRRGVARCAVEQVPRAGHVQDQLADGHADPRRPVRRPEDPERKVLDRERRARRIGAGEPAPQLGVVGLVEAGHPGLRGASQA